MASAHHPCDFCGQIEATCVADQWICNDCYIAKGSCCAGDDGAEDCTGKEP